MNCTKAQTDIAKTLRERAAMVHDLCTAVTMMDAADIIDRLCTLVENQHAELQRASVTM